MLDFLSDKKRDILLGIRGNPKYPGYPFIKRYIRGKDDQDVFLQNFDAGFEKDILDQGFTPEEIEKIKAINPKTMGLPVSIFLENPGFSEEQAFEFAQDLNRIKIFGFFQAREVMRFFIFAEKLARIAKDKKIDIIYGIDRSGRIIAFLIYKVLIRLGFGRKIKCLFIHADTEGNVTLHSDKHKKLIAGKNVLLIDDFVDKGTTIKATKDFLQQIIGPEGEVIPCAFSSAKGGNYNQVAESVPTWYSYKQYSGYKEKTLGGVELNIKHREIARNVRKALSGLARIIAKYLRGRV